MESDSAASAVRVGRVRWVICGLLFAATAINYIDRQIIGVLKPTLQAEYGWSEIDYGDIIFWFQAAYALGYISFGRVVDRVGARTGYALAVTVWTIAHMAHAACTSLGGFMAARFALGLGEAGNFPSGLKAVAEWFPKKERALAVGIFNAGANVGAIVTPLIVPVITIALGWRAAFLITGLFTIVWLVAWWAMYRRPQEHARVTAAELALIQSDPPDAITPIPWTRLLKVRETWAYAAGKFLIDPIWWMFLFWLPDFFAKRHGLDLKSYGPPLVVVYILSDVGSIFGGWMSSSLMKRGVSLSASRKWAMFVCAVAVLPIMFAMYIDNLWMAVLVVGIATAAHQGFSCNLYTLPSDVFPRRAVASVVGIGGTAGAIGGMLMAKYAGWVLDAIGSYTPIFIVAGTVYLVALLVIHLLSPRYEAAKVE
ncbi:MFS transporter [Roseiterribacter gracilis]|uniref:MFS transporter n=1 Tax=Roseiterribacter gracilis TaxID=2812848 RepID=A0A8S8X6U1_9PROT|nr:MFS transporter [Rhodospirillales bacterium TMPK1]